MYSFLDPSPLGRIGTSVNCTHYGLGSFKHLWANEKRCSLQANNLSQLERNDCAPNFKLLSPIHVSPLTWRIACLPSIELEKCLSSSLPVTLISRKQKSVKQCYQKERLVANFTTAW
jgi:hypothetical protein